MKNSRFLLTGFVVLLLFGVGGWTYHVRTIRELERQRNNLFLAFVYNTALVGNALHEGRGEQLRSNTDEMVRDMGTDIAGILREKPTFAAAGKMLLNYSVRWNVEMPPGLKTAMGDLPAGTLYQAFEGNLDWPPSNPDMAKVPVPLSPLP